MRKIFGKPKRGASAAMPALMLLAACGGADEAAGDGEGDTAQSSAVATASDGSGTVAKAKIGDREITIATGTKETKIPLGLPRYPNTEVGYEMGAEDFGGEKEGRKSYSLSLNSQDEPGKIVTFYKTAFTEAGAKITSEQEQKRYSSLQAVMPSGEQLYVQATDLKEKRGYVQIDLSVRSGG